MEFKKMITLRKPISKRDKALGKACSRLSGADRVIIKRIPTILEPETKTIICYAYEPVDGGNKCISDEGIVEITVDCGNEEVANAIINDIIMEYGAVDEIRLQQLNMTINNLGKANKEMLEEIRMLKEAVYVLLDAAKAQQSTNRVVLAMADALVGNKNGISQTTMTAEEAIVDFENRNKQR